MNNLASTLLVMSSKISVSIIEDNKSIRENVSKYISFSDDLDVLNAFGSVESYLAAQKKKPDVISDVLLLDIGLPGMSGIEGIPHILELNPAIDIVILTTYEEEDVILKAICLGAVGYISKKSSLAEIIDGIRIVNNGGSYMSPMIAREIFNHFGKGPSKISKPNILSPRQMDILLKLVEGKTYQTIASELGIAVDTVKSHIKKLYKVLHVKNKAEAISKYLKGDLN